MTSSNPSEQAGHEDEKVWIYSPEFWDRLPEIYLTRNSLRELDRRNRTTQGIPPVINSISPSTDLVRFARHGGPDLDRLRGVSYRIYTQWFLDACF